MPDPMPDPIRYNLPRAASGAAASDRHTVAAGAALTLYPAAAAPWSLSVVPATGGSALVELSLSPVGAASPLWHTLGTASAPAGEWYTFLAPVVAIRVTASAAAAVVELCQ